MYESPIDVIHGEMQMQLEGEILRAVQNVGVSVNKEELLKALAYDRNQYEKGYADAEAQHGWIPCDERLPEEDESVLVQDYEGHITIERCKTRYGIIGFEDGYGWASANNNLAWMPLPAPYQPNKKGED